MSSNRVMWSSRSLSCCRNHHLVMVADGVSDNDGEDFVQGADAVRKGYEDVAQGKAMAEKLLAE